MYQAIDPKIGKQKKARKQEKERKERRSFNHNVIKIEINNKKRSRNNLTCLETLKKNIKLGEVGEIQGNLVMSTKEGT